MIIHYFSVKDLFCLPQSAFSAYVVQAVILAREAHSIPSLRIFPVANYCHSAAHVSIRDGTDTEYNTFDWGRLPVASGRAGSALQFSDLLPQLKLPRSVLNVEMAHLCSLYTDIMCQDGTNENYCSALL